MRIRSTLVVAASAATLFAAVGAVPADATTPSFSALSQIQDHHLLGSPSLAAQDASLAHQQLSSQSSTANVASRAIAPLSIAPHVTGASATAGTDSSKVLTSPDANYGVVTGLNTQGTNASFIAIKDASAPSTYQFTIGSAADGLKFTQDSDGSITVTSTTGEFVNVILPAWATDVSGKALPTYYTVSGNVVTQHIDLTGAAFPVVADPSEGCGFGYCSIYFDKSETKDLGTAGFTALGGATAACSFAGAVGITACGLAAASIGATAQYATNHKECAGIYFSTIVPEWNPFTYTGKQCH